jgi:hypothetical protein
MTATIVIEGGTVTALAGGPVSLATLGKRKTVRVSNIEFNNRHQLWQVKNPKFNEDDHRHIMAEFHDYDTALDWERDFFNRKLAEETPAKWAFDSAE